MARGHPPPHCENIQVQREAITENDDDGFHLITVNHFICRIVFRRVQSCHSPYVVSLFLLCRSLNWSETAEMSW